MRRPVFTTPPLTQTKVDLLFGACKAQLQESVACNAPPRSLAPVFQALFDAFDCVFRV